MGGVWGVWGGGVGATCWSPWRRISSPRVPRVAGTSAARALFQPLALCLLGLVSTPRVLVGVCREPPLKRGLLGAKACISDLGEHQETVWFCICPRSYPYLAAAGLVRVKERVWVQMKEW